MLSVATALPLTRSCQLVDYPDCHSVSQWQQWLAGDAYIRWVGRAATEAREGGVVCYNWGAAHFVAPGLEPCYYTFPEVPHLTHVPPACAVVYALSVLDRISWPRRFLQQAAERLLPLGLIVCTFAAWDAEGKDFAVGHELRSRIYDRDSWGRLLQEVKSLGLQPFGGVDLRYHGDTLGDHTLASLVLVKGACSCLSQ